MEEMTDVIIGIHALNMIKAQIANRQVIRADLWEKIVALDGEITGLREAEHVIQKMDGYNVALPKRT